MNTQDPLLEEAKKSFVDYLDNKMLRKTQERFAVLEGIYSINGHFDVETLFLHLKKNNHAVSLATVYNTLDLLYNCDLVAKHQFGFNQTHYEKSSASKQHDHIICGDCNKVIEFCDPRIQNIISVAEKIFEIDVTRHSLTLHGNCRKANCENRKQMKKY